MAIPDVSLTLRDGALGIVPSNVNGLQVKLGVSPLGAVNSILAANDLATLQSLLGKGGPMTEAAALALAVAGGPIYCVPVNPSTYGTASSVTKSGTGAGSVTLGLANPQQVLLKIVTGGAVATATFQTSLDGGATYGNLQTTAATVVLTGMPSVTLAFTGATGGSFVAADVWTINTAATATLSGTGTGSVAISTASPVDAYTALITIVATGGRGTGTFTYSLDNAQTASGTITIPSAGVYVIPDTGVVATFSNASFTAGDTHSFTTTASSYNTTDLTNAWNALVADSRTWAFAHVVGAASSASASAALLASLDTLLSTAATAFRYVFAMIDVPTDTDGNLISAFAASSSTRVSAGAGYALTASVLNGRIQSRSASWHAAARASKVVPSEDLGRVATGPVPGITSSIATTKPLVRDEQATPALDAARFTTLRSIIGRQGSYITNGRLMATLGSDFIFVQYRRLMDIFCAAIRQSALNYLNDTVRVDATTGFILEKDARAIESYVESQCRAVLTAPGYASDLSIAVNRNVNIISTGNIPITARLVPLGYAKAISVDVGFSNPALKIQ